jgi:ubiquinone/menaquinone biosynthesis C-methylase UbiE
VTPELADTLREEMRAFYERRGESLDTPAARATLDTNSTHVARRAAPLWAMLARRAGGTLEGAELVDLGAGFGSMAVWFAAAGARVTAVDVNAERFEVCVAVALRHGFALETVQSRMERLDLPDASYDAAVLSNSICYLVDRDARAAALAETLRVLRPGGALVIRDANRWYPIDQHTGLPFLQMLPADRAERVARLVGRTRSRVRLASPAAARQELRAAGFHGVEHERPAGLGRRAVAPFARYYHLTAVRPPAGGRMRDPV